MNSPRHPRASIEDVIAVACLAALVLITLANVVTRYVTDQSFAWTEEISVFLMVMLALAGASAAATRDRHIRIELLYDSGGARRRQALRIAAALVTAALFLVLAALFARIVQDEIRWQETTMGLGLPRWWFTIASPILCAAIAARALGVAWRAWREPAGTPAAGGEGLR